MHAPVEPMSDLFAEKLSLQYPPAGKMVFTLTRANKGGLKEVLTMQRVASFGNPKIKWLDDFADLGDADYVFNALSGSNQLGGALKSLNHLASITVSSELLKRLEIVPAAGSNSYISKTIRFDKSFPKWFRGEQFPAWFAPNTFLNPLAPYLTPRVAIGGVQWDLRLKGMSPSQKSLQSCAAGDNLALGKMVERILGEADLLSVELALLDSSELARALELETSNIEIERVGRLLKQHGARPNFSAIGKNLPQNVGHPLNFPQSTAFDNRTAPFAFRFWPEMGDVTKPTAAILNPLDTNSAPMVAPILKDYFSQDWFTKDKRINLISFTKQNSLMKEFCLVGDVNIALEALDVYFVKAKIASNRTWSVREWLPHSGEWKNL